MGVALYVTHPEIIPDENIEVGKWSLSDKGRQRANAFAKQLQLTNAVPIYSSTETKAIELAQILAHPHQCCITQVQEMGENDRSSTGFLPPPKFEQQVRQMFKSPDKSIRGWESAKDAQYRITQACEIALQAHDNAQLVVFCGHGCVGTLLKCHLGKRAIRQDEDQRVHGNPGGGNYFMFDIVSRRLISDWQPMEQWQSQKIQ